VHGLLDHHRNLRAHRCPWILCFQAILVPRSRLTEFDIIAREASGYRTRFEAIDRCVAEVEQVNARPESAALTTSRALAEISRRWDAVYEAMRRSNPSVADRVAGRARRADSRNALARVGVWESRASVTRSAWGDAPKPRREDRTPGRITAAPPGRS
jgi:hypothetical protein